MDIVCGGAHVQTPFLLTHRLPAPAVGGSPGRSRPCHRVRPEWQTRTRSAERSRTSEMVAFQESPVRVPTVLVRPSRSVGRARTWPERPTHSRRWERDRPRGRGLIDEGGQPGAEVEVPLGAEALEPLTGFGTDADMKRYTVQHKDTHQHIEQQSGHNATRRHTHPP